MDNFLNELVGGEENRAEYILYNQLDDIFDVIIAYDDEYAEVKRVFIKREYGTFRECCERTGISLSGFGIR